MKRRLFLGFVAVICILGSCSKDDGLNNGSDSTDALLKAKQVQSHVVVLPPSGGDDTDELLAAIAEAEPGTVIQLTEGVYHSGFFEIYGFDGCIKGAGREKTFIEPAGLLEVNPMIGNNILPTWWKIIGGNVTLSDFAFRTGDGSLISDVDPFYNKTLSCLLMVNNYNADFNPDNPVAMNFTMKNVDFICGYLDPEVSYLGEPYNILMAFWLGTDVYWPLEDIILTAGKYNITNCNVENAFQGFEGFSLGEEAIFTVDGCKTVNCLYGLFNTASYNSRIYILNNIFKNTKYYGVWISDNNFGLLQNVIPFKRCEYVIAGNTFYPLEGSISILLSDELSAIQTEKYLPLLVTAKNNLFYMTEGSTGISCLNSSDATIRNNRLTGACSTGIYVNGADVYDPWTLELLGTGEAENVLILGNNYSGLVSTEADVVLGEVSSNCTVVGNGRDDVIDLGDNNMVVGMKKVNGGTRIGPSIRDNFRIMPGFRPGH